MPPNIKKVSYLVDIEKKKKLQKMAIDDGITMSELLTAGFELYAKARAAARKKRPLVDGEESDSDSSVGYAHVPLFS